MSLAELVLAARGGQQATPVERTLARWDGVITREAVERVNIQRLLDQEGDKSSGEDYYRGSLLGSPCPRQQMLSKRGYIGDQDINDPNSLMQDGTHRHYLWQEIGLSAGFLVDIEYAAVYDPYTIRVHLDGVMADFDDMPGRGGFELKTTNRTLFNKVIANGEPHLKDLGQVGGCMIAAGMDWFSVIYEVRDYSIQHKEFIVYNDDRIKELTHTTMQELFDYEAAEELPPVLPDYPRNNQCANWCNYTRICPSATY